jgi:hypothetical protein
MAFSDTDAIGGDLVLKLENAPRPRVHVRLAKHAIAYKHGAAKLHGTYSCRHAEAFAELDAHLQQRSGRLKIPGDAGRSIRCDGKRRHWSVRLVSPIGTYAQGRAWARVTIVACGLLECRQHTVRRHVHLAWNSSSSRPWMAHPTHAGTLHGHPVIPRHRRWPTNWGPSAHTRVG